MKRAPRGGSANATSRSSSIDSFDLVLPRGRLGGLSGGFRSLACSMPLGLICGRPGPPLSRGDLVTLSRNRSAQLRHLCQKLQHQVLQLGRRQVLKIRGRRHTHLESDSRPFGNLIILPLPRVLPLLLQNVVIVCKHKRYGLECFPNSPIGKRMGSFISDYACYVDAEGHAVAADRAASLVGDGLGRIEPHAAGAVSARWYFLSSRR